MRWHRRAQSTLEYAVIIAVVVGALLAMQIYMKRGVQGKIRESADQIGEQFEAEGTSVERTTTQTGITVQTVTGGVTTSEIGEGKKSSKAETRTETGTETIDPE